MFHQRGMHVPHARSRTSTDSAQLAVMIGLCRMFAATLKRHATGLTKQTNREFVRDVVLRGTGETFSASRRETAAEIL